MSIVLHYKLYWVSHAPLFPRVPGMLSELRVGYCRLRPPGRQASGSRTPAECGEEPGPEVSILLSILNLLSLCHNLQAPEPLVQWGLGFQNF